MNTPEVHVTVESEELVAAIAELDQVAELAGAIVIPVADLPAGSVVSISITVGPVAPAPAPEPTPEPRARPMMGTGRR